MKLSCFPWEEGKDRPNQSITYSAFLPTDQQGMQNTDSETVTETNSPHGQLLPQRTGTTNRHQCSNLVKESAAYEPNQVPQFHSWFPFKMDQPPNIQASNTQSLYQLE